MKLKTSFVVILCAAGAAGWAQVPQRVVGQKVATAPRPTGAPASVAQLTNAEKMPSPPRVSFSGGELTVIADNSSMQEILNAIHGVTGSQFDVQSDSGSSRVFGKFGPGPVSTVVGQILRGGGISYILVSSPSNPGSLQRAMLMGKLAPPPPVTAQPNPQPQSNGGDEGDNNADAGQYEGDESVVQPPEPPQQQPNGANGVNNANGAPQNGTKTPEQLLQELQLIRQQQIQQIQQQQRGGVPPTASPQQQ